MSDRPKDIRRHLTVIQGGKKDDAAPQPQPQVSGEFNIHGFLSEGDTLDTSQFTVPPKYYGKTVNSIQYGDPTKKPVLLYVDQNNQPVFDY